MAQLVVVVDRLDHWQNVIWGYGKDKHSHATLQKTIEERKSKAQKLEFFGGRVEGYRILVYQIVTTFTHNTTSISRVLGA